jgi:hypothetical protein
MAKEDSGRTKGKRPEPAAGPGKRHQIAYRLDDAAHAALGRLREKMGVLSFSPSDTAREILLRKLREDGLL